jgi:hypothetical protein
MARPIKSVVNIGDKFNRLTVINRLEDKIYNNGTIHRKFECLCDCGNTIVTYKGHLTSGHTKSCGCFKSDNLVEIKTTHNMYKTRIYRIWNSMIQRATNTNIEKFSDWVGRGISVCDKWRTFEGFYEDMKDGYSDDLTIDRIDNDGNYSKANCKWSTIKEQCNNRRSCIEINFKGILYKSLKSFCEHYNFDYRKIRWQYYKSKSIEYSMIACGYNPAVFG